MDGFDEVALQTIKRTVRAQGIAAKPNFRSFYMNGVYGQWLAWAIVLGTKVWERFRGRAASPERPAAG
jgi:hypothetical protein